MTFARSPDGASSPARKRILVVLFSQSGQLARIVESVLAPLRETCTVHVEWLRPQQDFPFPWSFFRFLDAFPESALLQPTPLQALSLTGEEDFDLVLLPYQVWFLAPAQPVVAFLQGAAGQRLLRGKPVVTIIACRNMWLLAQEKMKALLDACGARLLDNVVLTDRAPTLATLITTPRWMLTGRRDRFLGLPPAGVPDEDIHRAARFGVALRDALGSDAEKGRGPLLAGLGAASVDPRLYASECAGTRSFMAWGRLLRAVGPAGSRRRRPFLCLYVIFLLLMILTVVPVSLSLQYLLRPFLERRLAGIRERFEQPSGSGTDRLHHHEH